MTKRKKVYVCSPLSAPSKEGIRENMLKARMYMAQISERYECHAVAPHAYLPELLDDHIPEERQLALDFGLQLLKLCDCLVICGDYVSAGMRNEIKAAKKQNIKICWYADKGDQGMVLMETQKVILCV